LYCNDATAITVQCTGKKKKKVKVYSAHCCSTRNALRHGLHGFTCNYTYACLHQMAPPQTEVADII